MGAVADAVGPRAKAGCATDPIDASCVSATPSSERSGPASAPRYGTCTAAGAARCEVRRATPVTGSYACRGDVCGANEPCGSAGTSPASLRVRPRGRAAISRRQRSANGSLGSVAAGFAAAIERLSHQREKGFTVFMSGTSPLVSSRPGSLLVLRRCIAPESEPAVRGTRCTGRAAGTGVDRRSLGAPYSDCDAAGAVDVPSHPIEYVCDGRPRIESRNVALGIDASTRWNKRECRRAEEVVKNAGAHATLVSDLSTRGCAPMYVTRASMCPSHVVTHVAIERPAAASYGPTWTSSCAAFRPTPRCAGR